MNVLGHMGSSGVFPCCFNSVGVATTLQDVGVKELIESLLLRPPTPSQGLHEDQDALGQTLLNSSQRRCLSQLWGLPSHTADTEVVDTRVRRARVPICCMVDWLVGWLDGRSVLRLMRMIGGWLIGCGWSGKGVVEGVFSDC